MIRVEHGCGPFTDWASTDNLALDSEGRLFRSVPFDDDREREPLGQICAAQVPDELEPELEALREAWADSESRGDVEREWNADYLRSIRRVT